MKRRVAATREQQKEETRRAFVSAAEALFCEKGLETPSLDEISERAGYTRGAFYVHFRDRDELVAAVIETSTVMLLDALVATGDEANDFERTIDFFVTAVESGVYPIPGVLYSHQVLQACARSEKIRERYVAAVTGAARRVAEAARHGQAAGTVRQDVDADEIGLILIGLVMSVETLVEVKFPLNVRKTAEALKKLLLTSGREASVRT